MNVSVGLMFSEHKMLVSLILFLLLMFVYPGSTVQQAISSTSHMQKKANKGKEDLNLFKTHLSLSFLLKQSKNCL